jgi:hypothetical protein
MFVTTRQDASLKTKITRTIKRPLVPLWLNTQKLTLWQEYQKYQSQNKPKRNLHSFCIGLPKTGTHSIARMLDCRSAHEPETHIILYLYKNHLQGTMSLEEQVRILKTRDVMLWLEMESSWVLGLVIKPLIAAFPQAKYVLTVREPMSWLESQINEEIETGKIEPFASAHAYMFGEKEYTKEDAKLAELGHYSLAGYLSYWANQHRYILDNIPQEQLMIVKTQYITEKAENISNFVGANGVDRQNTVSYERKNKKRRLSQLINSDYLREQTVLYTAEIQHEIEQRCVYS